MEARLTPKELSNSMVSHQLKEQDCGDNDQPEDGGNLFELIFEMYPGLRWGNNRRESNEDKTTDLLDQIKCKVKPVNSI